MPRRRLQVGRTMFPKDVLVLGLDWHWYWYHTGTYILVVLK